MKLYIPNGTTALEVQPWQATRARIEYYNATTGELVNLIWGSNYKGNTSINWTELPNANVITEITSYAFDGCT